MILKTLDDIEIRKNRIAVRVDWNVPIDPPEGGKDGYRILDDSRMRASFPTFDELLNRGCRRIYIFTHLGKPKGYDEKLRTFPLKHHFVKIYPRYDQKKFTVLDNIRFDPREEKNSGILAKRYAGFCETFVNDAFSVCHRAHMSTVAIAKILPSCAGLLLQKEFKHLSKIRDHHKKPFVIIIGGAKIEDKKPMILAFEDKADWILVGGKTALEAEKDANIKNQKNVILPVDYLTNEQGDKWDIGPKTIKLFLAKITGAKSIFWNGNLGKSEEKGFEKASVEIAQKLAKSSAEVITAGGDTEALISQLGLEEKYRYVSLSGGASLEFMAGKKLPGLEVLLK
ncbi:hypothetical protein COS38_00535 [Candidatus Berkelbacteria bacterium CG03_land_8_20_14_0_80_40_36]|uniref:Phosphoglycerate kinase n=1 Tax=Candidatus Berkelbacteria bacterium CG03_land_8_20_14_0_80_40_36 TaxID=1974509 RepID=A0A2M7CJ37_9BACT|nr:MAG: hypothetical protein COS38_00535 [Candidatus Berkelbacteria bacterium CG03_land_8_20_14_0_80_40_36]